MVTINLPPLPINRLDSAETIAALRAIPSANLENGQDITVDGSVSVGDGLGGIYTWSELSVLADNGATVIKPDDVPPLSAGRWILISASGNTQARFIGTEDFSGDIIPDGSTAQEALQALETAVELRPVITASEDVSGIEFLNAGFPTVKPDGDLAGRYLDIGMTLNQTTPIADGYVAQFRTSATTGEDVYSPQVPAGYYYTGTVRSVVELQPGTTVQHGSAIDAYAVNYCPSGSAPNEANAVCLFAQAVAAVDNAHVWTINTATNDSIGNVGGAGVGRILIGWEHDVDVNRTGTNVVGAGMIIQGNAAPLNADAYQVSTRGTTAKWTNGYITDDASCTTAAMQIGATATSGANIPSQKLMMSFRDGTTARHQVVVQASSSALNFSATTSSDVAYIQMTTSNINFGVSGGSTDINMNYLSKGAGRHIFTGTVAQRLLGSATPAVNSEMVFELTSDTSLTIRVRGNDGVTRSVALTLA